jgi:hypothetical protein
MTVQKCCLVLDLKLKLKLSKKQVNKDELLFSNKSFIQKTKKHKLLAGYFDAQVNFVDY